MAADWKIFAGLWRNAGWLVAYVLVCVYPYPYAKPLILHLLSSTPGMVIFAALCIMFRKMKQRSAGDLEDAMLPPTSWTRTENPTVMALERKLKTISLLRCDCFRKTVA